MPRRSEFTISVVFRDVEFHANRTAVVLNVTIAILPTVVALHRNGVDICVDTSMCFRRVHIEFDVAPE